MSNPLPDLMPNMDVISILEAATFAAIKHQGQIRKDQQGSPYVSHPLTVAKLLVDIGGVTDEQTLVAAILHDTIEDTPTTPAELREQFGSAVLNIILEVSDDKNLEKMERKRRQVIHAAQASLPGRLIKLADKLANCKDILASSPRGWSLERRQEYMQWASDVVYQIRGTNAPLEQVLDQVLAEAERKLEFTIEPFSTIALRAWAPSPLP